MAGPDAELLERRIGGAEIAEARGRVEAQAVGQAHERTRPRGDELAEAAVRIILHDLERAPEIALQRELRAVQDLSRPAHPTVAAAAHRVDVDPFAHPQPAHLRANLGDYAGWIEPEDRPQRQRRARFRALGGEEIGDHALEIGNDATRLHLDQYIGRARLWNLDPVELHRLAVFMQAGCNHRWHGVHPGKRVRGD